MVEAWFSGSSPTLSSIENVLPRAQDGQFFQWRRVLSEIAGRRVSTTPHHQCGACNQTVYLA